MKKTILYTTILMLSIFAVTGYFTACKQDSCVTRDVDCMNGGTCKDGDCLCALGYEGDSCQFKVNKKFDSYYACIRTRITNGSLKEDNDDTLHVIALNDKLSIRLFSIRDSIVEVIDAKVDGNYVTIPEQTKDFIFYLATYTGTGSLNNGVLTITLFRSWMIGTTPMTSKTTYVGYKYE